MPLQILATRDIQAAFFMLSNVQKAIEIGSVFFWNLSFLLAMADNAASIGKQRSMPRYGWETRDRIIKPSEIYDEEKAREIMGRSETVLAAALGFFATLGAKELDEVQERIEQCLKR